MGSTHTLSSIHNPVISMPMPYHIYNEGNSTSGSSTSSGVGSSSGVYAECSSASSISTSSVSPSSSSSTQQSQSSPPQHQITPNRSSYLLTTASSANSAVPYATIEDKGNVQMPYPTFNNLHIENHYNNSNQSLSDGKWTRFILNLKAK